MCQALHGYPDARSRGGEGTRKEDDPQGRLPRDLLQQGATLSKVSRTSQNSVTGWEASSWHPSLWRTRHIQTLTAAYPEAHGTGASCGWTLTSSTCLCAQRKPTLGSECLVAPCRLISSKLTFYDLNCQTVPEWFYGHGLSELIFIMFPYSCRPFVCLCTDAFISSSQQKTLLVQVCFSMYILKIYNSCKGK